jgi:hypothetical protein
MNANQRPSPPHSTADVLHLDNFRARSGPEKDIAHPYAHRIQLVRSKVIRRLENFSAPAVAVAAAFIDADGHVGVAAAGIEPEMAACLARELRILAATLDTHSLKQPQRNPRQRGGAATALLIAVCFAAAAYINDIAWLDAVISIAAQIAARLDAKRSHDKF